MSNAPEEFDKLQKMLRLKRYEQPPPGYFNSFSTNVVNRLERAARQEHTAYAWFQRLIGLLESNPVAAGLFGMSVCGLLITGITYSESRPASGYSGNSNLMLDVADASGTPVQSPAMLRAAASVDSLAPSTSALFTTNAASLFDIRPGAQLVSYPMK